MNFPKFLFRKNAKPIAISESSEQPDDETRRSESSFSIVSRPSSSHSTHDPNEDASPRTSGNPTIEEGDRAFNEANALLSRYRDAFHDNSDFKQLEERLRK